MFQKLFLDYVTLVFKKVRFISIIFNEINYGSYLPVHAVSSWVSSELYRVFFKF